MPKPSISGRVPQTLKDDFDEYREENELSITDAQRELLRAGLAAKRYQDRGENETDPEPTRTLRSGTHATGVQGRVLQQLLPIIQTALLIILTLVAFGGGI